MGDGLHELFAFLDEVLCDLDDFEELVWGDGACDFADALDGFWGEDLAFVGAIGVGDPADDDGFAVAAAAGFPVADVDFAVVWGLGEAQGLGDGVEDEVDRLDLLCDVGGGVGDGLGDLEVVECEFGRVEVVVWDVYNMLMAAACCGVCSVYNMLIAGLPVACFGGGSVVYNRLIGERCRVPVVVFKGRDRWCCWLFALFRPLLRDDEGLGFALGWGCFHGFVSRCVAGRFGGDAGGCWIGFGGRGG